MSVVNNVTADLEEYRFKRRHRHHVYVRDNDDPSLGPPRMTHFTLKEYRAYPHMNAANWVEDAHKFSIVRNPYDRLWSEYKFNWRKLVKWEEFCTEDFLNGIRENPARDHASAMRVRHLLPQSRFFGPGDRVDVLRFETLEEDFYKMVINLGLPLRKLPHANKSKGESHVGKYDDHRVQVVKGFYREDLERFGYDSPEERTFCRNSPPTP